MSAPLVTIISATYNRPAMFSECAAAVLAQTFTDWVWWVVFNFDVTHSPAIGDVKNQVDYQLIRGVWDDDRVLPIYYPVNKPIRENRHVPAQIVKRFYPKVTTPYIYWLSDDDLIDCDGLGVLVDAAGEENWDGQWTPRCRDLDIVHAVYGRCEVVDQQPDGTYAHACWCYDAGDVGLGTGISPHCRLDGGQVLHTADLWRRATVCEHCGGKGYTSTYTSSVKPLTTEWQQVSERYTQDPCAVCGGSGRWQLTDAKADAASNDGTLLARLAKFARFHYVPVKIVTHRRHAGAAFHRPQLEGR